MVTKWLRRNRISSPLLSSRFWRNIRRLRKYLAPRSLSFRFLPCPALPFRDYASNFCNRFACSNFFTVRKRKVDQKSGYPLDYAIGCTVHVPPPLDPRIYAIIQTVYLWTERAFLVFVFSFFSLSHRICTPTEYGAGDIRETDGWIWSFSGCQRNPIPRSARASRNEAALEFECPEEFGYYPHPRDCTQYYVCVFGGALLESCTGGLMYRWVLFSKINS